MDRQEIVAVIAEVVAAEGAELVDVDVSGSSRKPFLRAYVDVPGGTTLERCAALSRKIEAHLEGSKLVGERYTLEVSSPGLNRPLTTRRDFDRYVGRKIKLRTRGGAGSPADLTGVLDDVRTADAGEGSETFEVDVLPENSDERVRVSSTEIVSAKPWSPW